MPSVQNSLQPEKANVQGGVGPEHHVESDATKCTNAMKEKRLVVAWDGGWVRNVAASIYL